MREKFNLIQELRGKNEELVGTNRLALVGQGDFVGANNVTRGAMNIKHKTQHLAIDNPEFPFFYDGKENVMGENSSFYFKTDKNYEVVDIVKKYNEFLKGRTKIALYFLYCRDDDSYKLVERQECENLTENFGFDYVNDTLDSLEVGDKIPKNTLLKRSTSYDENGNVGVGLNGRILNAIHPAVQDDAIIVSESFAKRAVINNIITVTIPINNDTMLLNLHGKDGKYIGLPDIGMKVTEGVIAATRPIKETRMFSDLRDASLNTYNIHTDQVYYADGEIIDINVYCNNPNQKINKVNRQLMQYYYDCRWFFTEVYKVCKRILKTGASKIDKEINNWMRMAIDYLDTNAIWDFGNDNNSNMMVELLVRRKEPIKVGRKIVGRAGTYIIIL